jgi:uncharacterized protein
MEKITPIEIQLRALYNLQLIDSRLDKLQNIRGELPMEVSDLEDEIIGLETRLDNIDGSIQELKVLIDEKKTKINDCNSLLLKYEGQQMHVKNNREYVAISKEMELQKLEIMACDKKIKEYKVEIAEKEAQIASSKADLEDKKKELHEKQKELTDIIGENEKEEADILVVRNEAEKTIEERLIKAYNRIRGAYQNKLAVVNIERDACGGCFSQIPPQRQLDVRMHLKIIVCENCGRVLVDNELAKEISEQPEHKLG